MRRFGFSGGVKSSLIASKTTLNCWSYFLSSFSIFSRNSLLPAIISLIFVLLSSSPSHSLSICQDSDITCRLVPYKKYRDLWRSRAERRYGPFFSGRDAPAGGTPSAARSPILSVTTLDDCSSMRFTRS